MSCGVGCRHSSNLALLMLWLWHKPSAVVPVRPLAWEAPDATGVTVNKQKEQSHRQGVRRGSGQGSRGLGSEAKKEGQRL